jgi:hypothetical protein
VPERHLNRREIADLADGFRGLLEMIEADEMSATTAMTYRIQGAVTALDNVVGRGASLSSDSDDHRRT